MDSNASSSMIQDWFVINDGRWAHVLGTSRVSDSEQSDAGSLAAAA